MAKKTSKGGKKNGKGNKKSGSKKLRKDGVCTALKKQKRQRLIPADKSDSHIVKRKTKRPASVSDHFRNFDERMAAKSARRTGPSSKASVVSSTFVMAPPTFQFNPNPVQPPPASHEIEGFHGFLSALDAPKDAPALNLHQVVQHSRSEKPTTNIFSLLDNGDEENQKKVETIVPSFIQPATFTFGAGKPMCVPQSSLRQSMQSGAVEIDPDL